MPGVPSSRGCDACRKVKKRCDELKPACSRCTRLSMTCVGAGQQRYKFKCHQIGSIPARAQSDTRQTSPSYSTKKRVAFIKMPAQVSSTDLDRQAASFVGALQVTDIRYAVIYYGPFFRYIPQRLGSSPVLDAAVKALSAAYPFFHTGSYPPTVLANYGHSLRALRMCLNDANQTRKANTICAVYLIAICQSWLGKYDDSITSHGEAISHLLKAKALHEWDSRFEMEMALTLCVPVILEAIINPKIKMDPDFWRLAELFKHRLAITHGRDRSQPSTSLQHLAMFPEFVQNPDPHLFKIMKTHIQLKSTTQRMRQDLDQCTKCPLTSFSSATVLAHSRLQAAYTVTATMAVLLNSILRIFDPCSTTLANEATVLCDDITAQAELASCYRPLGAGYMPLCLVVAWAASNDLLQMTRIEAILAEYQSDFADVPWMSRAIWLSSTFDGHRTRVTTEMHSSQSP